MPLACASGLYLQGAEKMDCESSVGTSPSRSDNSPFFQLGTVELMVPSLPTRKFEFGAPLARTVWFHLSQFRAARS